MTSATYDLIFDRLSFPARIGVCDHECGIEQEVVLDIVLTVKHPGDEPALSDIVDFRWVVQIVRDVLAEKHWDLIETVLPVIGKRMMTDARIFKADITFLKTQEIKEAKGAGARYIFSR